MLITLYSFLLTITLLLASPWWLYRMLTTDRYREGLRQRLGQVSAGLRVPTDKQTIWLHAVSVGEVLAATRLVAELEQTLADTHRIVISTTTRTGQALAKQRFGAQRVFYLPLDFAFCIRPYLRALQPAALILMESELWPRLLHECATRSIPVAVANARMSDRSYKRALKVRAIWSRILRKPTLWLAQSEQDADRLRNLLTPSTLPANPSSRPNPELVEGAVKRPAATPAHTPTIQTTGNLKYDIRAPIQSPIANLIKQAANGRPIIVAGSTVDDTEKNNGEDGMAINAWVGVELDHHALLVIAPRHPENFKKTEALAMVHRYLRASDWKNADERKYPVEGDPDWSDHLNELEIVVLDTIGDLASVYGIATIAFVGGSLAPRGGHNPLEPAQFGVPVIMGPSFENFRDIVTKMNDADAIRIVQNQSELEFTIAHLLQNPTEARALGNRGRQVYESQQGATTRTITALLTILPGARP